MGANGAAHPLPDAFVEAARRQLNELRAFRIAQLTQLDVTRPEALATEARTEVHVQLRAGAARMLSDIDFALRAIRHGTYGRCQRCGGPMSLSRLTVLPMALRCGSCQLLEETDDSEPCGRARS